MRWDFRKKKLAGTKSTRPTYQNPLYAKKNWQSFIIQRFSFFGWLVLLVFLLVIYAIFYSPLLQINKIEISGTSSVPADIIEEKFVKWQLEQRKWLIFRQNNILLFSKKWLQENIEQQYTIDTLAIDKKLLHTLSVTITERTPTLVWKTNEKIYYLDENGFIASAIANSESVIDLPQILDEGNESVNIGQEILTNEKISFIKELVEAMPTINALEVTSYSTPHQLSTQINVQVTDGYQIYFDSQKELTNQIEKLRRALTESESAQSPQEYIDLRIGDRVYVK